MVHASFSDMLAERGIFVNRWFIEYSPKLRKKLRRTMLCRFLKATGYNLNHYLQRIRVQKACDLLESSQQYFEYIAERVPYEIHSKLNVLQGERSVLNLATWGNS
jgi:hypothetical protein